ncbi:unnamed protein product [Prorocentrum cordatum]|uniref:Uncharacterized protein n=1 Tax=Prorocentrum cordatum TaxID=2364126 RepID=A0ABN9V2M3_9DINO|nr:unnamed protein product [Polarella glacialis]
MVVRVAAVKEWINAWQRSPEIHDRVAFAWPLIHARLVRLEQKGTLDIVGLNLTVVTGGQREQDQLRTVDKELRTQAEGADLNRNGIPDALEGALLQAPGYAQPQYPAAQPQYPAAHFPAQAPSQMAAAGVPFPSPSLLGVQPTPMGTGAAARVAAAYGMGHAGASSTPVAWQYLQPGASY